MDHKALARKIRDAIFDQAEQDGRVLHGDTVDATIERVLAAAAFDAKPEGPQVTDAWQMMVCAQPYRPIVQSGTTKHPI